MEFSMIGQYQAVHNQFIRNNHWEMNQERYTHTSFSKGPATSTYLLLTSNQAQCKPEMDGSQKSEKNMMEQFQKNLKQMKRKITKDLEKFSRNIEQRYPGDDDEMDQTGSVQIILKEQENIRDRFRKMENEVEKFQNILIDEWDESDEETEKMIEKSITEMMKYSDKIDVVIKRSYDIIDLMESSTQPAHDTKFNHLNNTQIGKTNDKLVNPEADKFNYNLIKLNNGTTIDSEDNVNTEISYNVDDDSAEEQAEIAQLREAKEKMKVLQARVHMYEDATSCKDCNFTVSGKMKPSKSRQKLKAHREKHHMAHVAVAYNSNEEIGSDKEHKSADIESLIPVYADTGLDEVSAEIPEIVGITTPRIDVLSTGSGSPNRLGESGDLSISETVANVLGSQIVITQANVPDVLSTGSGSSNRLGESGALVMVPR